MKPGTEKTGLPERYRGIIPAILHLADKYEAMNPEECLMAIGRLMNNPLAWREIPKKHLPTLRRYLKEHGYDDFTQE
jgi:hypothetical protein